MSDDFKKKLDAYEKGELLGKELEAFESELGKLEKYQQVLSETDDENVLVSEEKKRKVMRRGKWKARISTAFYALSLFILFSIVTSALSAIYFAWGNPDRGEVFRNVIDHTITITNPYGYGGTSTNVGPYFTMEATRDLEKQVGNDIIKTGELKTKFFFSLMSYPEHEDLGRGYNNAMFVSPKSKFDSFAWDQLDKLPEGTVVSAYVTFSESMETSKVFQLLEEKDLELLWLAVDTGREWEKEWDIVLDPIGLPSYPIWHEDDMILSSREEKKGFLFGGIVSEGYHSPDYEVGDPEPLHVQFLKTLRFLEKHERKANKLTFGKLYLEERISYLENNGINHYGVVITGPTKEVLTLQDESWVHHIEIDEIALWNWHSFE